MDEEKLLNEFIDGDQKALEKIIAKYSGYVYTVAKNFSKGRLSAEELDDIVIEIFYKLWERREKLNIKIGLCAYLSAAARNAVKNRFRDFSQPQEDISELDISADYLVEDKAVIADMMNCLDEGISQLSEKSREIFLRFYLYGESSAQIAKAVNISENAVRTDLHRTRVRLKNFMNERGYDHV